MFSIDLNFVRAAVTVLSFITFLGIVAWALSRRNQSAFDEAAQLPFCDNPAANAASASKLASKRAELRNE